MSGEQLSEFEAALAKAADVLSREASADTKQRDLYEKVRQLRQGVAIERLRVERAGAAVDRLAPSPATL